MRDRYLSLTHEKEACRNDKPLFYEVIFSKINKKSSALMTFTDGKAISSKTLKCQSLETKKSASIAIAQSANLLSSGI